MSRDPIERSLEIEQAQLRGFARSFAEVEWLLLILVVLYLYIANPAAPNVVAMQQPQIDPSIDDDQLEIPAFLRRQAN